MEVHWTSICFRFTLGAIFGLMELQHDGHPVFIATGGHAVDTARDTLVFLHGAALDHTVWTLFRRYFSRAGYNALALDLPGHGRSGGAPLTAIADLGAWVAGVLDELAIQRLAIVGHSLGSLVALDLAAREPQKLRHAVLLGTALPMVVGEVLLDAARADDPSAIDMIMSWGHAFRSQLGGNPVAGVHIVNVARRIMERARRSVLFTDLNACNSYTDGPAAAAALRCPVTLILGKQDRMTPPQAAQELARLLADVRVEMIDDCGHMMMAEQPEATHRCLVRALS